MNPLSQGPAHATWIELSTRITAQDLHFRSGQEEAALESIVHVFRATRDLMKNSPGAGEFLALADIMLKTIRPFTARWHALIDENKRFRGPAERRQFRKELLVLQPRLLELTALFEALAQHGQVAMPPVPARPTASLGVVPVPLGIGQTRSRPANAADIDQAEWAHVAGRRGVVPTASAFDGVGLALSGGGIRSATFCLGVVQVLAEKKLLPQFDYVSTVSGGGYFGSFMSNHFDDNAPPPDQFGADFDPTREESPPIRHLRNSSKYLLPKTTLEGLMLAAQLLSGIVATTLLAAVVPVLAASLVRLIAHVAGFGSVVGEGMSMAAWICGVGAAVCWLLRPLKMVSRPNKRRLDWLAAILAVVGLAALVLGATPPAIELLHRWSHWAPASFATISAVLFITGPLVVVAMRAAWTYRKALSRLFMLSGVVLFTIVYLWLVDVLGLEAGDWHLSVAEWSVLSFLVLWTLWALSINLNETGLHRYYRDRLTACYLEAEGAAQRSVASPPPLGDLSDRLPYHLINTTVNVTSSRNPELRGRGGDFFLLSKFYCGSPLMKYKPTAEVVAANADLDLATAMAISGAAASANMGGQTMREYRTLMAIFNVRLGYWMKWQASRSVFRSNAFVQLTREIFGWLGERSAAINLSDGGHIENLAAYELIRRKMRFIVCVDGGMDRDLTCPDLNRLQRLVAIDFGYRIEFDPTNLKTPTDLTRDYGLMVKIDYTPELEQDQKQLGWMLYIKLAMMGTEANYVLDYRREYPNFPHQTTADQFFDEAQFEAYRKLGETAAGSFFALPFHAPTAREIQAGAGFTRWFEGLVENLVPDTDPVFDQGP